MSKIEVPQGERGVVRVFSLSMEADTARRLKANAPPENAEAPRPIEAALGVTGIDANFVEIFPLRDIAEIGLDRYLEDGNGIEPAQLDPDRRKLAALEGWVLLVHSGAFGGRGATLAPAPELALVGTYSEPGVDWRDQTRLATAAAEGTVAPARKTPSEAAISGRVAAIVLVVLFILTAVVVWIAA